MSIYDIFAKYQSPNKFYYKEEAIYYEKNAYRLNELEAYAYLSNPHDPFLINRANIILRALENKPAIEKLVKNYKKNEGNIGISFDEYMSLGLSDMPYMLYKGKKLYVPLFPFNVALCYGEEANKLLEDPYKKLIKDFEPMLLDPFDYYGYSIFISYFTSLILVKKTPEIAAFYDYDAETIYIVNDQGRLDTRICLFDKFLVKADRSNLLPRIGKVVDAYLEGDKEKFLDTMMAEGFASYTLVDKIKRQYIKKEGKLYYPKKGNK